MNSKERKAFIGELFEKYITLETKDILQALTSEKIERTTIYRDLKSLLEENTIQEIGRGKYKLRLNPKKYLEAPFFERKKVGYNSEFLRSYIPNTTFFLNETQRKQLSQGVQNIDISTESLTFQKRNIENLLIDISFSSSHLEGNSYSYLDTDVLVRYNEVAENKLVEETQMILNHKKLLEYMIYHKDTLAYNKQTFFEVHTLLGDKLLPKEDLGIIRKKIVEIGGSAYTPLDNTYQLNEEFEIFLQKLSEIQNPFEQSLFILVFIPYFQIFLDINKRTSRMMCNLPLLKNRLGVISLLQVKKRDYIDAILAIYELNDVNLLAKVYTENYLLNLDRYI